MKLRKRRPGAKPGNKSAQIYKEPMTRCMVVRMTEDQYAAFAEQCKALRIPVGTQGRELCLEFAGWVE